MINISPTLFLKIIRIMVLKLKDILGIYTSFTFFKIEYNSTMKIFDAIGFFEQKCKNPQTPCIDDERGISAEVTATWRLQEFQRKYEMYKKAMKILKDT